MAYLLRAQGWKHSSRVFTSNAFKALSESTVCCSRDAEHPWTQEQPYLILLWATIFTIWPRGNLVPTENQQNNIQTNLLHWSDKYKYNILGTTLLWCATPTLFIIPKNEMPKVCLTHPGFTSSQVSSCPALGASMPVRIFPLSTWITFTGKSLIWLVSSRGYNGRQKHYISHHFKLIKLKELLFYKLWEKLQINK